MTKIGLVLLYNLLLFFGASYLVAFHDFSWWIFLLVLLMAASYERGI